MRRTCGLLALITMFTCVEALATEGGGRLRGPSPGIARRSPPTRLASGVGHSCIIRPDGSVRCWGNNLHGQLGDGTRTDRLKTVPVPGLTGIVAVACGGLHTCALRANGTVACWGQDESADPSSTTTDRLAPVDVAGLSNVVEITAGRSHTCALSRDGIIRCWGRNQDGEVGDGTRTPRPAPVTVTGLSKMVSVSAGNGFTCAIQIGGRALCWGENALGELGDGTRADRLTPVAVGGGVTGAAAISAGFDHACMLLGDGTVKCWGFNQFGQIGDKTTTLRVLPVNVDGATPAVAISASDRHTCAILPNGNARCWGNNDRGQIGDGTTTLRNEPTAVQEISNAVSITGGFLFSCALGSDHLVRCWGSNSHGSLGDGTITQRVVAVAVADLTVLPSAVAIAAGAGHTCAVRGSGEVACWGGNDFGQLGKSGVTSSPLPVAVVGITNAIAVAVGDRHTCVATGSGTVRCWGKNTLGQLGNGTTTSSSAPSGPILADTVAIAAGLNHTCALQAKGVVQCWGDNAFGQLGNSTTIGSLRPVTAKLGTAIATALVAGDNHTCALLTSGDVMCWGKGDAGQIGIGGFRTTTSTPVLVSSLLSGAVALSAGATHTCASLVDGSEQCWGGNGAGQLGDGTRTQRDLPVTVRSLETAAASAGGLAHTCALLSDGTVRCWGADDAGQLGTADSAQSSNTPVVASGVSGVLTIAAAGRGSHTCALLASGVPGCWGLNASGQLGDGTTVNRASLVTVGSFAANIRPAADLTAGGRGAEMTVFVLCEEGRQVRIEVTLDQEGASGAGRGDFRCTGRLEDYPVGIHATGRYGFEAGPAAAKMTAEVRDRGAVDETFEWSRAVTLSP